jgi:hypothetical protein
LRNYVWIGSSTAFLIGPANSAVAGHVYTWAFPAKSGAWPVQEFDGAPVVSTQKGAFGTGTTAYPSTILLRIGAGYGDNATCVPGKYGRFWVFDSRVSDAFITFLDLTIRFPRACYGIGDEDVPGATDRSPVMAPVVASVGASGTVDVNILAPPHASDPDGQSMTAGTEAPAATLATTSIVANNVRCVAGAVQGVDRIGVKATAGTKTAHALLTLTVGAGTGGGGGGGNLPLTPDYTGYWKLYKKSTGTASATQHSADVELTGGTAGDGQQAVALVSIARPDGTSEGMFKPPYTLEYDYTPIDNNSVAGGVFAQLGLLRHTGAGNANLGSIGADLSPTDVGWGAAGVTGIRFSFDTKNPDATLANKIRGRANDTNFGAGANYVSAANLALGPNETLQDFVFPRNQASHLAWSIPGDDTVTVTATIPGVGDVTQSWKDGLISTYLGTATTNIVLASYAGRDAKFANVIWTDGGGGNNNGGGGSGDQGLAPDFPDVAAHIAGGGYFKNTTGAALQADYNALTPSQITAGVMLLVNYGNSEVVNAGLTLGKSGTAAKPIIIRVGGWHTDKTPNYFVEPNGSNAAPDGTGFFPGSSTLRATISWTGACTIPGSHNWVRGLRFQGGGQVNGDNNRFNCCLFDGATAKSNDNGVETIWDWCEFFGAAGAYLYCNPRSGARRNWFYRCWFHGNSQGGANDGCSIFIGTGAHDQFLKPSGTPYDAGVLLQDCLFEDSFYSNSLEVKGNGQKVHRCSQRKGSGSSPKMLMRHGDRGTWLACHFGDGNLTVRGIGSIVADCTATGSGSRGPSAGNISATDWDAYCSAHINDANPKPANNYATGEDVVFAGCDFDILLGYNPAVGTLPPTGTIIESDCTGAINRASGLSPAPKYTTRARSVPPYRETPGGPVKKPRMWTGGTGPSADVGPNGTYSSAQ